MVDRDSADVGFGTLLQGIRQYEDPQSTPTGIGRHRARQRLELGGDHDDRRGSRGSDRNRVVHAPRGAGPSVAEPDDANVDVGREAREFAGGACAVVADTLARDPTREVRACPLEPRRPLVEHPLVTLPGGVKAEADALAGERARIGTRVGIDLGWCGRGVEHPHSRHRIDRRSAGRTLLAVPGAGMRSEVVADGVTFGEGPVWLGSERLAVTSVPLGFVYEVDVATGEIRLLADVDGGANGAAACSDGGLLVTNNGGIDLSKLLMLPDLPIRHATPCLQRVSPDGDVTTLAASCGETSFSAPNDLVVAADGTVFFTDPPHWPPDQPQSGRVWSYRDGDVRLVADGFHYCNGIALTPEERLVVVELRGLMDVDTKEWVVEHLGPGGGDGFCYDRDGRAYVASTMEHGIRVVEPDGTIADFWPIEGEGLCTNCCFGGDDLRTLFVTDAVPGAVVAFGGCPTPGLPLHRFPS